MIAGYDAHLIAADARPCRVEPGLPRPDIEFPAVPRAAEYFPRPAVRVLAGQGRLQETRQTPDAERAGLVRAAIPQREELPADVEDADGLPGDLDNLPPPVGLHRR